MSNHGCEKCAPHPACNHIRENIRHYDPKGKYGYFVTYIGGYAVVSGDGDEHGVEYRTVVVAVGFKSIGQLQECEYAGARVLHSIDHTWDYFLDSHEATCMGLKEKLLSLSK